MKEVEELRRELRQEKSKAKPTTPKSSSNNPLTDEPADALFQRAGAGNNYAPANQPKQTDPFVPPKK